MSFLGDRLRPGRFEQLEPRQLLAGDVAVSVVGSELLIQGDALDNKIMVTAGAEVGSFVVTGVDGTTVHLEGQSPAGQVSVTGVRSARIRLGEGSDLVAVVGADFRGSLGIEGGVGDDRVRIGTGDTEVNSILPANLAVTVRGLLRVSTGAGEDQVSIDNAMLQGWTSIETGADNDAVSLGNTTTPITAVNLSLNDVAARVRGRGGIHVGLGEGNDTLNLNQVSATSITALGGAGNNNINANTVHSAVMSLLTGGGADNVSLSDIHARLLAVHTGDDNDTVEIRDSVFTGLAVSLGGGNDSLTTAGITAQLATMLGGPGEDTLNPGDTYDIKRQLIRVFEFPPDINTPIPHFPRRLVEALPIGRRR
jgi:hypothetical protein